MNRRIASAVLLGGLLAGFTAWGPAHAATAERNHHRHHVSETIADISVKGQDLYPWTNEGVTSQGILAAAKADGITLPAFGTTFCGSWTGPGGQTWNFSQSDAAGDISPSAHISCNSVASPVPVFEDYNQLQAMISAGMFAPGTGITRALYDIESWSFTPAAQSSDPAAAIRTAVAMAKAAGIALTVTPGGKLDTESNLDAAIEYGAAGVAIQSQGWGDNFATRLAAFMTDLDVSIQDYAWHGTVTAGLATDPGGIPNTGADMHAQYLAALNLGITHFWLNSDNWGLQSQCNPSQGGPGCPQYALWFLWDAGLIASQP